MSIPTPILRHPQLKALYQHWCSLAPGGGLPQASELDPADLRPWLSNLVVIKADGAGGFVYGYYSRDYAETFDGDKVGQSVDSLPPEQAAMLKREYEMVIADRMPASRVYTADFDGEEQTWERLVLPFDGAGGGVEKLMVAAYRLTP